MENQEFLNCLLSIKNTLSETTPAIDNHNIQIQLQSTIKHIYQQSNIINYSEEILQLETLLEDIIPILVKFWLRTEIITKDTYSYYSQLSSLHSNIQHQQSTQLFTQQSIKQYSNALTLVDLYISTISNPDSTATSLDPLFLFQWLYQSSLKILSSLQSCLDSISPELLPIHERLVDIKLQLQSLLLRNSPHAFSLLEVSTLQDQLLEIDSVKIDGKFISKTGNIISGQGRVIDLLEMCYEDVHDLLSSKDVVVGTNPLRSIYEQLITIRAKLTSHQNTFKFTLDVNKLHEIQRDLGKIDDLRVDGKFLDASGNIPKGQAVLHFLLHKCYRLARNLVNSMEPVSDSLSPHYNQLLTLRKCLFELSKWNIKLTNDEMKPYNMKLKSLEDQDIQEMNYKETEYSTEHPTEHPTTEPMEDTNEANEQQQTNRTTFPQSRIKNIMRQDKDVHMVATDAVFAMSVATELFLEILGRESFNFTKSEGRKAINYKDVSKAVGSIIAFEFLEDTVPATIPMKQLMISKNPVEKERVEMNIEY